MIAARPVWALVFDMFHNLQILRFSETPTVIFVYEFGGFREGCHRDDEDFMPPECPIDYNCVKTV